MGVRGSMWESDEHPLYAISPDQLATVSDTGELVLTEAKTALDKDIWGEELSDEIPVYYRCQVMWGMGILGIRRAIVGVLTSFLEFREYEVIFDQSEFDLLLAEADRFMDSLRRNEKPDIDSHSATYEVIKQMHPQIDANIDVDVPAEIAVPYTNAKAAVRAAEQDATLWTAKLADHMGDAKTARFNTRIIATRQARGPGLPYVQAARNLTALPLELLDMKEAS
jgi:predicted phage-related endonuclease